MPADVERLFRIIAPALVLLAGCEPKEPEPKAEAVEKPAVVAKALMDVGSESARMDVREPEPGPGPVRVDVGDDTIEPLDLPPDLGTPDVGIPDPEPTATPMKKPLAKPEPPLDRAPMRKRASCPSGTWCTDKASAKEHAVPGATFSKGCPDKITRGAKGLDGPMPGSEIRGFDATQTKAKRAEGTKDACCYGWFSRCPGGRPLLGDAGTPVVASFETGLARGWSAERERLPASPQARAFAAQAWLDDAAMEHASVASFGRVALELLSLGAPPDLVEGAHLAALDEIRHAKTCLSLARACGADELEPGRLAAVPQRSADFARFAADTFIEGCVGETLAALVVTRAAAGAEDAAVRRALEEIAADEARHAALAWRMVSWAIERGGTPVLAAVHEAAERLHPTNRQDSSPEPEPKGIDRLGRLSESGLAQARRDGWIGIIEPMLKTLQTGPVAASLAHRTEV